MYVHFQWEGAYKYMCYRRNGGGAECAVRCVHMSSVGMGQENLKQRLTIHSLNLFQGDQGAQARTSAQSPLGQVTFL